jgi:transcriptional regulator with XRE-family HTH domain
MLTCMQEDEKWNPIESIGATGATVAANVKRLRNGTPYTELSGRLAAIGRAIPTLGLRKIESGGRRVDVDDLVAIALALGVSPATLLMPAQDSEGNPIEVDAEVEATGFSTPVAAQKFWEWLLAADALDENVSLFIGRSWPVWVQRSWHERARAREGMLVDLYRKVPGGVPAQYREPDSGDDK